MQYEGKISRIQIYALTERSKEEVEKFQTDLQQLIYVLKDDNDRIIITGDWNTRIGNDKNREEYGKHREGILN